MLGIRPENLTWHVTLTDCCSCPSCRISTVQYCDISGLDLMNLTTMEADKPKRRLLMAIQHLGEVNGWKPEKGLATTGVSTVGATSRAQHHQKSDAASRTTFDGPKRPLVPFYRRGRCAGGDWEGEKSRATTKASVLRAPSRPQHRQRSDIPLTMIRSVKPERPLVPFYHLGRVSGEMREGSRDNSSTNNCSEKGGPQFLLKSQG